MAIVKMNKISLIGLDSDKHAIIEHLMGMGVVEITNLEGKIADEEWCQLVARDGNESDISALEEEITKVKSAIDYLQKYDTRKKGLFEPKRTIEYSNYTNVLMDKEQIWSVVERISEYDEQLSNLRSEENKLMNLIGTLEPWKPLTVPVEVDSTKSTAISLGVVPAVVDTDHLAQELYQQIPETYLEVVNVDKDQSYLWLIYYKVHDDEVMRLLKQYGFTKVTFKELSGTIEHNIRQAGDRIEQIRTQRKEVEQNIANLAGEKDNLEVLYDHLVIKKDQERILTHLAKTNSIFMLEGWLPLDVSYGVQESVTQRWDCVLDITEPEEEEDFPILLANNDVATSVESITSMYSPPHPREVDPNVIMAPFFIMFFGLMLSDAGYGLIMALGAGFIVYKYELEDGIRRFMKLMMYCGFATIFWGALFGGWFGNLIPLLTGVENLVKPLWFNPVDDPEKLLQWSLLFGVVHIYIGISVKGMNLFKQGKYFDILWDVVVWYIVFTGLVFVVLPYIPKINPQAVTPFVQIGKYLLIAGFILLILTQGREQKNIILKLLKGVTSLYDLVGFMSDVLSYSRLLALGLATSVIASIVNEMGAMAGLNSIIGILVFIIVFLLGHTFNFLINALGAYVHSSRLQYIEFFGRFYKGGGIPFKPFRIKTQYIKLKHLGGKG